MYKRMYAGSFQAAELETGTKQSFALTLNGADGLEQLAEEANGGVEREAYIPVHAIKSAEPGPTLLVLAAVHGDEYEGVQTIIELCRDLQPDDIRGTLLMVPVTNVLSYYGETRTTPEDGCNLAREFPGKPDGTITQRLAWHLQRQLIGKADFMLDLHSGGTHFAVPELVGYYHNDDSEVGRRSRAAAEVFGMEVLWAHPEIAPGRTVSAALECGVPFLYTEAYGGRRIRPDEQLRFRGGALRLMRHLGMLCEPSRWIEGESPPIRYRLSGDGNFDVSVNSAAEGFFIPEVALLDEVTAGVRIGAVYDWFGTLLEPFHAPKSGVVVGMTGTPYIRKGAYVYMLTQTAEAL
ncbi:succinylglutamate desuccinylase/aspartoacylase family protein [Paenibacillus sp. MBLB4367]|uniref:succinylglutamate desuccinylase/aspartoacylase family protein n=1 Tax=Paenibacillus sp. MBLB4367 TaxID=3384767 RepID=UPI003907E78C